MKRHLSVFMLMARSSIYKILGILAIMAAAQTGLFAFAFYRRMEPGNRALELVFRDGYTSWIFGVCFLLITLVLCVTGVETSSKPGYTLRRLLVSERAVFVWQCVYNVLVYLLLWTVQILVSMGLCLLYVKVFPEERVTGQTIMLAYYRSGFLHSILPFEDALIWFKNIVLVISLGICAARFPYSQRRGSFTSSIIVLSVAAVIFFVRKISFGLFGHIVTIFVAAICVWISLDAVLRKEEV